MKRRPTCTSLLFVLALCIVRANSEGTVFLERGRPGIVPCPPIVSGQFTLEETDALYWYKGQKNRHSLLISYFRGNIAPQNGIPQGVYDINREFSLVIKNVTASDEDIYFFLVKPKTKMVEEGHVDVCDMVSASQPLTLVKGCDHRSGDADVCEAQLGYNTNLTCEVDSVKPAVKLRWFRVFANGSEEPADASYTIKRVVLPPNEGSALRNHTYSTSASLQLTSVNDDVKYRCEAHGVAVGNGSHIIVRLTKAVSTTVTYSEAQTHGNTGRTPALTVEKPPKTCKDKPAEPPANLIVLSVTAVSLTVNAILTGLIVFRRIKRRGEKRRVLKSTIFKPVPTTAEYLHTTFCGNERA